VPSLPIAEFERTGSLPEASGRNQMNLDPGIDSAQAGGSGPASPHRGICRRPEWPRCEL